MSTATATKSTAPVKAPHYEMPTVEVGDIVYWFPHGSYSEPTAAIVSRLGHDNICVNLVSPNMHNFALRDGVRHVSDPNNSVAANEGGRWDYTPKAKWYAELEERFTTADGAK
jgi:hypothetical protein